MPGQREFRCSQGAMSAMLGRMYFEFEDSEVAQISLQGGALQIRFSAARLYEGQTTGAGNGLWQPLLLICKQAASDNQWLAPDLTQILSAMGRVQWAQPYAPGIVACALPAHVFAESLHGASHA